MWLAIYNFGIQIAPYDDPLVAGFSRREPLNFLAAERSEGFIARSGYDGEPGPPSWGEQVFPRFLKENGAASGVSSFSLWRDIESVMAYSYAGVHAEALKHGRRWNIPQRWPPLVLWWVDATHQPIWSQAVERLEHLHDNGPSPRAFHFKTPFGPDGAPTAIDRVRVKNIAEGNAAGQQELLAQVQAIPV
ncbi:DUF3291 domain-containing protein [Agrobacterium salinitolerans]|uniref:DUF3291 domain-containing protein n=1 Tax=Agrobacterium salinitolerans TaxID=1183413 RepID=UPI00098FA429|nr:DUF3291 domain-containing protein [Agrobacterium salinitolerans]OOO16730.1 hypothetical protein BS627_21195 [Agrobacterium salinitolerans]PNQ20653.1 DUF3291 domain-containing protein [Rhizobium sp. YIC5082]